MRSTPSRLTRVLRAAAVAMLCGAAPAAAATTPAPGPPLAVHRAEGPITLDGNLSDPGWQGIAPDTTWFETNVGDNARPQVRNTAWLAYDDKYFYAAFQFEDPTPGGIRAPLGDHDNVPGATDYAGVIVDSRNDGKTAQMFLANPNGVQYDAISSDVTGEDNSPDWFWDAVGRVTPTGWNLEIRIPFSSLRYKDERDPTWGLLLYRNYPRDRRYQFFTAPIPHGASCFICNESRLTGLVSLPHGSHLVVAPYAAASRSGAAPPDLSGPVVDERTKTDAGADIKWNPAASTAIDATINPDFSQIESDAAQITANERFALFYPEKRPFFLEGVDLFSMPLNAVYTRTITDPSAGVRVTGRAGSTAYTVLATQDEGGGLVILPGPQRSDFAPQEFVSDVDIVRVRHDIGNSFVSLLADTREIHGGGYNRVFGPDFQWRPRPADSFKGQFLWAETRTPDRPELTPGWDARTLSDHAAQLEWGHSTRTFDWYLAGQDVGDDFRADNGFIPQVGYRNGYFDMGYTVRPKHGFASRIRVFSTNFLDVTTSGHQVLDHRVSVGSGMDGRWNSFIRVELNAEAFRVGDALLRRFRPRLVLQASPSRLVNQVALDTYFGEEIDFANGRTGHGVTMSGSFTLRPHSHLELQGIANRRWIDVPADGSGRLFTAQVERLRSTWMFNARSFVRLIGQYVETMRNPALYGFPVSRHDASLSSSALLAYKLNWQTVMYVGYGDQHAFSETTDALVPDARQWFTKVSYAWQH